MIRGHRGKSPYRPRQAPTGPAYGITVKGVFLPFPPVPAACACGSPWDVAFPGIVDPPFRDTFVLCFPCARERGWPNIRSEEKIERATVDRRRDGAANKSD